MQEQLNLPESLEEWRDVVGWEGWYEVSSLGRVRRVKPYHGLYAGHVLKSGVGTHGYLALRLHQPGRGHTRTVHSLVAEAFIGPLEDGFEVNHKDANKLNPRATNLEYIPHLKNVRHSIEHGLTLNRYQLPALPGSQHGGAKLTEADVLAMRALPRRRGLGRELARKHGVTEGIISEILSGKRWRHV